MINWLVGMRVCRGLRRRNARQSKQFGLAFETWLFKVYAPCRQDTRRKIENEGDQ